MLSPESVRHVVFSGGGQRGFAYVGALLALQQRGVRLDRLLGAGGTSIGALFALLTCVGYSPQEMEKMVYGVEVSQLIDFNLSTLLREFGLDDGTKVRGYMETLLRKKELDTRTTFAQLRELKQKHLLMVGCNIHDYSEYRMDWESTPDMPIVDACAISMALPLMFAPTKHEGGLYIDGGLVNNFPMQYFSPESTVGLRLGWKTAFNLDTIDQFLARVAYCALGKSEQIQWLTLDERHKANTITIDVGDVSTLNLRMTRRHKEIILQKGALAVQDACGDAVAIRPERALDYVLLVAVRWLLRCEGGHLSS
jgi:predicted acylesterase/phospholipase RssA